MAEEKLFSDDYTEPEKKGWLTRLRTRTPSKKRLAELPVHRRIRWRLIKRAGAILMILLALYYPVGMIAIHKIDDNTGFTNSATKGQSHAVAIATAPDPGYVDGVLRDGAERADAIAAPILREVQDLVGFLRVK